MVLHVFDQNNFRFNKTGLHMVDTWSVHPNLTFVTSLTGDRRQARHFYLAKQFCFLDADCLVVGESQGSSRRSVGNTL